MIELWEGDKNKGWLAFFVYVEHEVEIQACEHLDLKSDSKGLDCLCSRTTGELKEENLQAFCFKFCGM